MFSVCLNNRVSLWVSTDKFQGHSTGFLLCFTFSFSYLISEAKQDTRLNEMIVMILID